MFQKSGLVVSNYSSTRGGEKKVSLQDAILDPAAFAGGLYVPEFIPKLDLEYLKSNINDIRYIDLALNVLSIFGINMRNNELFSILDNYKNWDNPENPAPVVTLYDGLYVQELWHGPTRAFKDMALAPFGSLLSYLALEKDEHYLIATATSGDTGPAALNGIRDKPNIKMFCMYPDGGTSEVQKSQMVTEEGKNSKIVGVKGNFDDTQNALKSMLASKKFNEELESMGYKLSAANSVNFGRIMFQIVYHIWGYLELVRKGSIEFGEDINCVIPSGNFGNGLACYYAKTMGLPVKEIVLASNSNNVLTQFFMCGIYDLRNRELIKTNSPAMDILKSSNIERILYHLYGPDRTKELMEDLSENDRFELSENEFSKILSLFSADFATDTEVVQQIADTYMEYSYISDPHTATAFVVMEKLGVYDNAIISSTAEWTKFSPTMAKAYYCEDDSLLGIASMLEITLPKQIEDLSSKKQVHFDVIPISDIEKEVLKSLG